MATFPESLPVFIIIRVSHRLRGILPSSAIQDLLLDAMGEREEGFYRRRENWKKRLDEE
jgi:hypothetical protein